MMRYLKPLVPLVPLVPLGLSEPYEFFGSITNS